MKRSKKLKKTLSAFVVLVLAGGLYYFMREKTPDPKDRLGLTVREKIVQRVTLAGNIEPNRMSALNAPYEGYIQKLYVKLGQKVKKGEPLVSIVQSLNAGDESFPIRAPFDGTVVQLLKTEGQFVKPGDVKDYIMRIDDLSRLFIHANAPEIDMVKVRKNQKTDIKASAILNRTYEGVVREISLAATAREQWGSRAQIEYLIKMEILNFDEALKPGMSCLIDIVTNEKDGVIALAHEFIHLDGDNPFVVLEDGSKVPIKLGIQNEAVSEVLEGVKEGTKVRQVDFMQVPENS